jgi:hypothetical protein
MTGIQRWLRVLWAVLILLSVAPLGVRADLQHSEVIGADVLGNVAFPRPPTPYGLLVQATSWPGAPYRYLLLLGNFSPWKINSLRVLDRYFGDDPDKPEVVHEWLPGKVEPGKTASLVIEYPDGALSGGCHQLEISMADALHTILMDCAAPGAATVWNVPLREEVASTYLADPVLTLPQAVGPSKLGLHVSMNSSPKIMDFVRSVRPAVVVAVGDVGWLADVKASSPKTVTIARLLEVDQSMTGDPVQRARDYVRANASRFLSCPGVDYWLGWNEPSVDGVGQMQWYAAFEAERIAAMAELGLKVAIGNFATGNPEADEFKAFLPAMVVGRKYGAILSLHEYSAPSMRDGVGSSIPGLSAHQDQGALTLRYRNWYNNFMRSNNAMLPLMITESGIDGGVLGPVVSRQEGWRSFIAGGASDPPDAAAASAYIDQLSWYDDQLRRDPYVLGFAVFNAGDNKSDWKSFDVTDILPQIAAMMQSKH